MPINKFRHVDYDNDGCEIYQCLACGKDWSVRTSMEGWCYCPHCGTEWEGQQFPKPRPWREESRWAGPRHPPTHCWEIQECEDNWMGVSDETAKVFHRLHEWRRIESYAGGNHDTYIPAILSHLHHLRRVVEMRTPLWGDDKTPRPEFKYRIVKVPANKDPYP